jgi:transposase
MARDDEMARRLMAIPCLGPVTASAMAASVQDVSAFSGPREFAAFLGLTPRQNSSGGKERLGRVSKMGNRYLRKLLVVGAHAVLYHRKPHEDALRSFAKKLIETKPFKLVAVGSPIKWRALPSRSCAARQPIAQPRRNDRRHR